jgi:hypothetical protein
MGDMLSVTRPRLMLSGRIKASLDDELSRAIPARTRSFRTFHDLDRKGINASRRKRTPFRTFPIELLSISYRTCSVTIDYVKELLR